VLPLHHRSVFGSANII